MLRMNVEMLKHRIAACDGIQTAGTLRSVGGLLTASLDASVGELCRIGRSSDAFVDGEVIGLDRGVAQIMPFQRATGLQLDAPVVGTGRRLRVPLGRALLGRVIDGLGRPMDDVGPLIIDRWGSVRQRTPDPLERPRIREAFVTGQRAIDGLTTCGRGQRVALLAGSGVGKSTLLGEIAKGAQSDVNVIALIGERGREVRPFLEDSLGEAGLQQSVVVVATADEAPLMRVRATQTAITIADHFRQQGANVLLLMDSLTRVAMAQREIGLLVGEPPNARGYTASVFQLLSSILEMLGQTADGAITGILTVLVDGDDMDDPIADAVRAIVDGHIVLNRRLAEKGHFPAIDVSASLSRVFRDVTPPSHQASALALRQILATHDEVEDLVRIGAYQSGSSPQVDRALALVPAVHAFLQQQPDTFTGWDDTQNAMAQLASSWKA